MAPVTPGEPRGTPGEPRRPQGGARGAQSAISTPLWEISTPHCGHRGAMMHDTGGRVVHHGVSQATLQRMAPSSNPMEASPLDLRSVTVLPRALLEVSPDPLWGDDNNNTTTTTQQQQHINPANINSPLQTSPPGWFVNPFGHPLTLIFD